MSGALQTANQELIRQLLLGQHAIETSLRRLRDNESKTLTWADEKENSHVFSTKSEENTAVSSSKETSKNFSLNTELLEADGNQRRSRSKRNAEEDAEEEDYRGIRSILARSNVQRRSTPSRVQFDMSGHPVRGGDPPGEKGALLGYDWIAGMLENCGKMEALDRNSDFFEQLGQFRRENKEECVAREFRHESLIEDVVSKLKPGERISLRPPPGQMSVDEFLDARDCEEPVFAYTVNERLFPTPLNPETEDRPPPTSNAPHIVKVSIPSYRLLPAPSRLTPHRRRSIDENDSFSLIGHCQVGFRATSGSGTHRARPADLPAAADREGERRRPLQPRSEKEAIEQLRRQARPKKKIPVDLRPSASPQIIGALARKELGSTRSFLSDSDF